MRTYEDLIDDDYKYRLICNDIFNKCYTIGHRFEKYLKSFKDKPSVFIKHVRTTSVTRYETDKVLVTMPINIDNLWEKLKNE